MIKESPSFANSVATLSRVGKSTDASFREDNMLMNAKDGSNVQEEAENDRRDQP